MLRSAAELFLIGKVGEPRTKNRSTRNGPFTGDVPDDLRELDVSISAVRRERSRKPVEMMETIEALFDGLFLELSAREQRPGQTSWGLEVGMFAR